MQIEGRVLVIFLTSVKGGKACMISVSHLLFYVLLIYYRIEKLILRINTSEQHIPGSIHNSK